MKPGTIIRLPNGDEGTVVYHGLDGYGIVWERQIIDEEAILGACPLFDMAAPAAVPRPEAMLRKPYKGADLPCVGDVYDIIE